jgi:hypothetical protein
MTADAQQAALLGGESARGEFTVAGSKLTVAGTLAWSFKRGAILRLIGWADGWPTGFGDYSHIIHGVLDDGTNVSLLYAGLRSLSFNSNPNAYSSTTLVWGFHMTPQSMWRRGVYETANLAGWIAQNGFKPHYSDADRRVDAIQISPPAPLELRLPRSSAKLVTEHDAAPFGYRADWSITARQRLVVDVRRRASLEDLHDRYAIPLQCFTTFASDRPDGLIKEVVLNPETGERAEIWRQGPRREPEPWSPVRGYLFRAEELPRLSSALSRWWRLHAESPALGLFADHINLGMTFSQPRFLTLHTAMEGYCRARFGRKEFKLMRDYAATDVNAHQCSNKALKLIGMSRDYVAHLTTDHIPAHEIIDSLPDSTRRGHALMQACLLRELGFGRRQAQRILEKHHLSWPLPPV